MYMCKRSSLLLLDQKESDVAQQEQHEDHESHGQLIVPEGDGKEILILKELGTIHTGQLWDTARGRLRIEGSVTLGESRGSSVTLGGEERGVRDAGGRVEGSSVRECTCGAHVRGEWCVSGSACCDGVCEGYGVKTCMRLHGKQ